MNMMRMAAAASIALAVAVCAYAAPVSGGRNGSPAVDDSNWRGGPTEDWFVNWDKALAEVRKTNKKLFLLNTGSDWCGWCKKLRAEVLDKPEFAEFARKNLVLVYLDSPSRNPLGKDQKMHNRQIVKALPFGGGVPHVLVMNARGEKLGAIGGGGLGVDQYLEKLRGIVSANGERVMGNEAQMLFKEGYAALAAQIAARRAALPPVTKEDFRAKLTGVAVVDDNRRYKPDEAKFVAPETPLEVPYGKTALFRVEYDFPEGYGARVWTRDVWPPDERRNSYYFGSNPSGFYKGKGTAYGFLSLLDRGKACRLKSVKVNTNSDPELDEYPHGWDIFTASVDLEFKEKSADWEAQQDAKRPPVSKHVPKGWTEDFEAARQQAAKEGKFVLLAFSGSDWCGPCMALEKEVLSQEEFVRKASEKYVLVMIAFPHDKSTLSKLAIAQNDALKKRYPIRGYPTIMVVNPFDGEEVKRRSGYKSGSGVDAYMRSLSEMVEGVEWPKPGTSVKPLPRIDDKVVRKEGDVGKSALERLREKKNEKLREDRLTMLESLLSAEEALKLAQKGEARGFYQLAISYAKKAASNDGESDVRNKDFETSDKCLSRAVEMRYGNALMLHAIDVAHDRLFSLKVCARHRHSNDWYLCAGMQKCTFDNTDLDSHTMKIDAFANQKAVAEVAAAFDRAAKAGVANASAFAHYITNELARTARIRRDRRVEDARMAAKLDDGVAKLLDSSSVAAARTGNGHKAPLLGEKNRSARYEHSFSTAPQPLPFAEAVRKAKEGDGYALYSVAMQYAGGSEIARDGVRAAKYLQKAADAGFGDAVFANALLKESTLCGHRYGSGEALLLRRLRGFPCETTYGNFRSYTGARPTDFKLNNDGFWNITNEIAVAEIRSGYMRAAELGVTQATNALERFDGWLLTRRNEIRKEMDEERQWREKIASNARLAKEFLGEEPSTNAVFHVRLLPGEAVVGERERQRQSLLEIQEQLRQNREERMRNRERGNCLP